MERQGGRVHEVQRRDGRSQRAAARSVVRDVDGTVVRTEEGRIREAGKDPVGEVEERGNGRTRGLPLMMSAKFKYF